VKRNCILLFLVCCAASLFAEPRSFEDLFPGYDEEQRARVFSPEGIMLSSEKTDELRLLPAALSDLDLQGQVSRKNPSFLVESLLVIPFDQNPPDLLGVYNGIGRVRDLKGRTYTSYTRKAEVALFEDAVRLESGRKLTPVPDPEPARILPAGEIIFMRLKDVNFGNCFYRADVSFTSYGLLYNLSNFKNLSYLFITVIKEDKFFARFYMEPLAEGVLIYSVSGADISDFVAKQVNMPSAISKRLRVITGWVIDGIK
jgi:hypothetical protein